MIAMLLYSYVLLWFLSSVKFSFAVSSAAPSLAIKDFCLIKKAIVLQLNMKVVESEVNIFCLSQYPKFDSIG
jgi:hypothetical protein